MAVSKEGGRSGGAGTVPQTEVPRAQRAGKDGEVRQEAGTPARPRVRAGATQRLAASTGAACKEVANTPTRQLRRHAAENGLLPGGSPVRLSPRPESPRMPASPPTDGSPRGKKRRAGKEQVTDATRQRKKARVEPGARDTTPAHETAPDSAGAAPGPVNAAPTATKEAGSSKETSIFRALTGSGLKGLLRKEGKTPSSEDLRRDPDDAGFEWHEAMLPNGLSFLFSRGAIPTTVLDSTTEEPPRQQHARASDSETEKG